MAARTVASHPACDQMTRAALCLLVHCCPEGLPSVRVRLQGPPAGCGTTCGAAGRPGTCCHSAAAPTAARPRPSSAACARWLSAPCRTAMRLSQPRRAGARRPHSPHMLTSVCLLTTAAHGSQTKTEVLPTQVEARQQECRQALGLRIRGAEAPQPAASRWRLLQTCSASWTLAASPALLEVHWLAGNSWAAAIQVQQPAAGPQRAQRPLLCVLLQGGAVQGGGGDPERPGVCRPHFHDLLHGHGELTVAQAGHVAHAHTCSACTAHASTHALHMHYRLA